ncbi:hypothetical protein Tco_0804070 [Tanacetum coccineum]|uniref:Uncharacterized protein n=1 Tax=Tanacetum coccineum TaxID=301880 RepID=A0ABQ5A741_9ASTR
MDDDTNKSLCLKRKIKLPLPGVVAAKDSLVDVFNSLMRKAARAKLLELGIADASTLLESSMVKAELMWIAFHSTNVFSTLKTHSIRYLAIWIQLICVGWGIVGEVSLSWMDDLNITIEEYIRLKEEKAQKREKVFNWKTAKYGKIWYDEDVLDFRSVETEFPAIIFNDSFTSNETPSCEPTVTIVYNDALTSKSNFSTKPTLCPKHIDKFDLKDETSLSEYDEVEQSVLYFNDLFPFNIVYPDDQKSDKGNDENEIDMIQSSGGNENTNKLLKESHDKIRKVFIMGSFIMGLNVNIVAWNHFVNGMLFNLIKNLYKPFGISFDPKRYYKDGDCARMLRRPRREIHRVQVFDFGGLPDLMAEGLSTRMMMEHRDAQGFGEVVLDLDTPGALQFQLGGVRRRMSWREFILALGLHSAEEMQTAGTAPYTFIRDPMLRLCHRLITCSIAGRSQAPKKGSMISGGQYVACLAEHFGLLVEERLQGLTLIALALPIIDMAELVRLQLCVGLMTLGHGYPQDLLGRREAVPPPPRTQGERIAWLEEEVHDLRKALQGQREVLDSMAHDFSRFSTWIVTSLAQLMDRAGVPYTRYSESPVEYQRRTKQRTNEPSTSTTPQEPDP